MPDPRNAATDDAESLLQRTEDVLKRTTRLLQRASDQLTGVRPETPRIAALRNELQVLRATVHLFEQALLRERALASRAAQLLKLAG
jgi:hypothetical protein